MRERARETGSEIRSVYLVDPGVAVIDVNAAFADTHRFGRADRGTDCDVVDPHDFGEYAGNSQGEDSRRRKETRQLAGHADLSSYYDVSAVNQLATELQPQ